MAGDTAKEKKSREVGARAIVIDPAAVLHARAREVSRDEIMTPALQRFISAMKQTLRAAPDGVGLAAPQIGESVQIFLASEEGQFIPKGLRQERNLEKQPWEYYVFVNPKLKRSSRKKTLLLEGCLSIPGKFGEVARSEKVELTWFDEYGKKHSRGFSGFFARIIQHEFDHLQGILIRDRAKRLTDLAEVDERRKRERT